MSTSASSSAIVVGTVSGYHLLKIDSYSRTRDLLPSGCARSRDFRVGGYTWHLNYYPCGLVTYSDFISLKLVLASNERILQHKMAQVQFSLLDQAGKPVPGGGYTYTKKINLPLEGGGYTNTNMINLPRNLKDDWEDDYSDLTISANLIRGQDWEQWLLVNNDCFTIRCDITLIEAPCATAPVDLDVAAPPSDLHLHLGALLLGEEGSDVTFQVGGECFPAHRCVLAARSSVFKAELFGAMKEGTGKSVVHVDGVEARVFKAFLGFVYTDALPDFNEEEETWMAQHLLVVADRYNMDRLKLICEDMLCKRVDVNSAATTLALAEQHCNRRLKEACLDFLTLPANLKAVEATDGFEHLATSFPAVFRELISKLAAL